MTSILASLSKSLAAVASAAAPWLVAVRLTPLAHTTGILWAEGTVVTADRVLPARDTHSLVLPGGTTIQARVVQREPDLDLALLRLDRLHPTSPVPPAPEPALGSLVVIVGIGAQAEPTVRLTVVHQRARDVTQGARLDLTEAQAQPGALALDPDGLVLGMVGTGPGRSVSIVPHRSIARFVEKHAKVGSSRPTPIAPVGVRRGWLGVALQPIIVPEPLVARAGQTSGRLVVGITAGGPADEGGLRVGDVLLSLDGHGTSGTNALRTFLESSQIGAHVEARVLRDTSVVTTWLTVAEQP